MINAGTVLDFVYIGKPVSSNQSAKKTRYQSGLVKAFERYHKNKSFPSDKPLYGMIYYFTDIGHSTPDADNISKPVWDALQACAYANDKAIRLRIAGIIETGPSPTGPAFTEIDTSGMSDAALGALVELLENKKHNLLYIQLGILQSDMIPFSL